jgi:hypothetical protein
MQVGKSGGAIDVVGVAGFRGNTAIERLAELSNGDQTAGGI